MRSFLAKCTVLALLAAGFAFTGDAGRFLARGRGVLEATTVPRNPLAEDAPAPAQAPAPAATPAQAPSAPARAQAPSAPAHAQAPSAPADDPPRVEGPPASPRPPDDAPVGQGHASRIPADGPDSVSIRTLAAGDRIVVWIRRGADRGGVEAVTFDVVDPAGGDAIETRGGADEARQASLAPRRRVRIAGSVAEGFFGAGAAGAADGTIRRRRSVAITPIDTRGAAEGPAAPERLGPVVAIEVVRRP